jgi:preprotein translocase subunit SecY
VNLNERFGIGKIINYYMVKWLDDCINKNGVANATPLFIKMK